jgi:hypothetical protein
MNFKPGECSSGQLSFEVKATILELRLGSRVMLRGEARKYNCAAQIWNIIEGALVARFLFHISSTDLIHSSHCTNTLSCISRFVSILYIDTAKPPTALSPTKEMVELNVWNGLGTMNKLTL